MREPSTQDFADIGEVPLRRLGDVRFQEQNGTCMSCDAPRPAKSANRMDRLLPEPAG